jgi:hypothetical protein
MLNASKRRQHFNPWNLFKDLQALTKMSTKMMARLSTGYHYWKVMVFTLWKNPKALRDAVSLMALYLHFRKFRDVLLESLSKDIEKLERDGDPRQRVSAPEAVPI